MGFVQVVNAKKLEGTTLNRGEAGGKCYMSQHVRKATILIQKAGFFSDFLYIFPLVVAFARA